MRPTIEYIRQKFNEYNTMIFEGKLEQLPFKLSRARTFLGQIAFKRRKNPDGTCHYHDFIFRISCLIDRPEHIIEDTIIHEMIHYYILSSQIQDTSSHGRVFRKIMNDINRRFNRNITITHVKTEEDKDNDTQTRQHLLCVIKLDNGNTGLLVASHTRLFQLWDALYRARGLTEWTWYMSYNPFFNRFSRSQSLKIYHVEEDTLKQNLEDARELIREGDTITVKKP